MRANKHYWGSLMSKRTEYSTLHLSHVRTGYAASITAALMALGALGTTSAMADNAAADDASTGPLQEIVVTATRHEEGLSKVPISVTALTQEAMDLRGIKDIQDVARFTPGVRIDNTGTNNISIRGISSSGGAGTTGIYLDDTPIQIRALAFNPDDTLPKSFDMDRVEVLRGPQGTLFGAGSEGGTVRYITTQPSLTKTSFYSRDEVSFTQGGAPSYEAGVAGGMPLIDGVLGARLTVWYRRDGGYIDQIDPVSLASVQKNANFDNTTMIRLSFVWAPTDKITVTPSFYYQDRYRNNNEDYWPLYSNPQNDRYVNADPTLRSDPDRFQLPALKIEGDLGFAKLISNTAYFHRKEETGYDGTLYNLGFYQSGVFVNYNDDGSTTPISTPYPLLDGTGVHLPAGALNYRSPASIDNTQQNITQEIRLQSNDPNSAFLWTTGLFYTHNRQTYLEQIHDPLLNELSVAATGVTYDNWFQDCSSGTCVPVLYDSRFPNDSYFLQTKAIDQQIAWFGEGTYAFTDQYKLTVGARYSHLKFTNTTLTGGPQLFLSPQTVNVSKTENSFTPKVSFSYQYDPRNLYYASYAKGFRPPGANNPVPQAACAGDFAAFGIKEAPPTFNSDSVDSFEVGAKNNIDNRFKIASSIYYIRWNNIQQTVVPPVCQISFISNLGQAVAKGLDIQAEMALTDTFTAELSAGYTEARYSRASTLSPTETNPVVSSGDAITGESGGGQSGQPTPPITVSLGLEYKFSLIEHDSFVRIDDQFQSRPKWRAPSQDANSLQYDPAYYILSPTNFASARAGIAFGKMQFSAFCDNLFDTRTVTNYEWSIDPGDGSSRLQRQFTYRPRTIGVTFTYRD
jgi:outer membrane receptor protein involved in Fe transport